MTSNLTGTVSVGSIAISQDSLELGQLSDVTASAPSHNDILMYNDSTLESEYADGWVSRKIKLENLGNVNAAATPDNGNILVWNDNTINTAYPTGWVNKDVSAVFSNLQTIVQGIGNVQIASITASRGDIAGTDHFMMTDTITTTPSGDANVSISSFADHNPLYKKEITDDRFTFVKTLSKGVVEHMTYTAGTVFRSLKGLAGISGPFPMPLCPVSLALKYCRFYISESSASVIVVSTGTECTVQLLEADGSTVHQGPVDISEYGITTLTAGSSGEYVLLSTGSIICAIKEANDTNMRPAVHMNSELIGFNTDNIITAQQSGSATNVTFYRQNNTTGTIQVQAGTSVSGSTTFGSDQNFNPTGALILKADNPISGRFKQDADGTQALPMWPLRHMAQSFGLPSTIGTSSDYGLACIAAVSKYTGTASVYNSSGVLVTSFDLTRDASITPASTPEHQMYPAAGRWKPSDESIPEELQGGYVHINVPACLFISTGSEVILSGGVTEDKRADIKIDATGLARRRDIDSVAGTSTWVVC